MTTETINVLNKLIAMIEELAEAEGVTAKQFAEREDYNSAFISDVRQDAFWTSANEIKKFKKIQIAIDKTEKV